VGREGGFIPIESETRSTSKIKQKSRRELARNGHPGSVGTKRNQSGNSWDEAADRICCLFDFSSPQPLGGIPYAGPVLQILNQIDVYILMVGYGLLLLTVYIF